MEPPNTGRFTPGQIADFEAATSAARSESRQGLAAAPVATVVNAVFYDGLNMGGSSLLMEASSGCGASDAVDWSWSALTSAWQNRIKSGRGYGNCEFKIWANTNFTGAAWGYWISSTSMSGLNGDGESVRLR
jgi:hypothetical protein